MRLVRELQDPLQALLVFGVDRQGDVHVGGAERVFPVARCIGTEVMQDRSARCHSLSKFNRETVQGRLRHAQRLEALESKGDPQPAGQRWHPPFVGGSNVRNDPPQHLASLPDVAYAQKNVFAAIG